MRGPSSAIAALAFGVLAALLVYPVHVPYQNPDQDLPVLMALRDLVTGGWAPTTLHYPSALTNLIRLKLATALAGAHVLGYPLDALDLAAAWDTHRPLFRMGLRLFAMAAGLVSLVAASRLATAVLDRRGGLLAALLAGTAPLFVREHHHGMWDAPTATAAMLALWASARYVRAPSAGRLAAATALAALSLSFKYNGAVALVAPAVALLVAPSPRDAWRTHVVWAGVAATATLLATSPAVLLEPERVLAALRLYPVFYEAYRLQATKLVGTYGAADVLRFGLGLPLLGAALAGIVAVARARERALAPLVAFVVLYGIVVFSSPVPLGRYALPLAAPLAVLAAYGLRRLLPRPAAALAGVFVVALNLPATLAYLRLLGRPDTRVVAARWLVQHVRPDARLFLPTDGGFSAFVGPDLPRPFDLTRALPEHASDLARHEGPTLSTTALFLGNSPRPSPGPDPLATWRNAIVVTSDLPEEPFRLLATPPAMTAALRAHAVLVADFRPGRRPGRRVYELNDLNYVPVAGARTLARPGPRVRVWWVRGAADAPTPFVGTPPPIVTPRAAPAS